MADASGQSKLHEKISIEQIIGIFGLATAFSTVLSEVAVFPGGGGSSSTSCPHPCSPSRP